MRAIVREGDTTTHGGIVLESFPHLDVYGKNASGVGHRGHCPQCKTDFVIAAGAANFVHMGVNIAVDDMATSCGSRLIASQHDAWVEGSESTEPLSSTSRDFRTWQNLKADDHEDEYEAFFEIVDASTAMPVIGLTYKLTSAGNLLVDNQTLDGGRTIALSPMKYPDLTFVAWSPGAVK